MTSPTRMRPTEEMTENRYLSRRHRRGITRAARARRPAASRWIMVVIAFIALSVQSSVIQTHIHIARPAGKAQMVGQIHLASAAVAKASSITADNASATPRDKYPINEDPSNCPLCQEISHSGQFLHSDAAVDALPVTVSVNFIVFDEALPSFFAVSHIWLGRAPPQS